MFIIVVYVFCSAFSLQSVRQESLSHRSRRQPPKLRVTDEQTMIRSRSPSPRPSLTELPVLHKPVKTKLQLVDLAGSECVGKFIQTEK